MENLKPKKTIGELVVRSLLNVGIGAPLLTIMYLVLRAFPNITIPYALLIYFLFLGLFHAVLEFYFDKYGFISYLLKSDFLRPYPLRAGILSIPFGIIFTIYLIFAIIQLAGQ